MHPSNPVSNTYRVTVPDLELVIGREFVVLDHGFIRVVDYMGGDESIAQAARNSYGKGTKSTSDDRTLIRYMFRHQHSTPFEVCKITLHMKLPIFVARQLVRHRMQTINEVSARYSVLDSDFYIPEASTICAQSRMNKQGRDDNTPVPNNVPAQFQDDLWEIDRDAYTTYLQALGVQENSDGSLTPLEGRPENTRMAREIARMVLPVNIYTQWYTTMDLRNLLHLLGLRMDTHAQWETRLYAETIGREIVARWCPMAWQAFLDYQFQGHNVSRMELDILQSVIPHDLPLEAFTARDMTQREITEFCERFGVTVK